MRLGFRLAVVDDTPDGVSAAIGILEDHLSEKGFTLTRHVVSNFASDALNALTKKEGKDFDLVMIDFNLGTQDTNGAKVASQLRAGLPYTDMVFYSSDPANDLLKRLADANVSGVFVATRPQLDDALVGLADSLIGKAIDLNHMRGIAMAEVAEMEVMLDACLRGAIGADKEPFKTVAATTLAEAKESSSARAQEIAAVADGGKIEEFTQDRRFFTLADKYKATYRLAREAAGISAEDKKTLKSYQDDIIKNRNDLAHAEEKILEDGGVTLRTVKPGEDPIVIDDAWMTAFRKKLHEHRNALSRVCETLTVLSQA